MKLLRRVANWLETHWVTPSYSGWLLLGLSFFFFGAATNTMSGWLYVISGVIFALLVVGAVLPERMLRGIRVARRPIVPVSAGEALTIELDVENQTPQPKTLIQLHDKLPAELTGGKTTIELIPPRSSLTWRYECAPPGRGIYRWDTVERRTAALVGLFWCRRSQQAKARAIVYPVVLPLSRCPIVDAMGQDTSTEVMNASQSQNASRDLTRTLRPYRWGDSMRLIHWRTSARYGDLRVRELETYTGGQELIVALDNATRWQAADFEQAVIAAASLYFYGRRRQMRVSLWTTFGQVREEQTVLETLAAVQFDETPVIDRAPMPAALRDRPTQPILWLTQNPDSLGNLPQGSRSILWQRWDDKPQPLPPLSENRGLVIGPEESLQLQLQEVIS